MKQPNTHTGADIVRLVDDLLARAAAQKASDVHLEPFEQAFVVRFRLDGVLHDIDRLPVVLHENVVARLKVLAGLLTYRTDVPQEGAFRLEQSTGNDASAVGNESPTEPRLDVRVATFPTVRGERAVVRFMHRVGAVTALDELGFPPELADGLRRAVERPHGLLLVTGPAGAGKSTTLHAVIRHLREVAPGRSIVTLEDPVERRVDGVAQIQIQPFGDLNYARAMRSLLRQDVEVVLVGEIRDSETARLVTQAALTGHLILSTLHSGDPAEALSRLVEMGVAPYQVVSAVTAVCSQRLLRRRCPACDGTGCEACTQTGYAGRVPCGQLAWMTPALREAVLVNRPAAELRNVIESESVSISKAAAHLVDRKLTAIEEVQRVMGKHVAR